MRRVAAVGLLLLVVAGCALRDATRSPGAGGGPGNGLATPESAQPEEAPEEFLNAECADG